MTSDPHHAGGKVLTRVLAEELGRGVTHVGDPLAVLVAEVHAVIVSVAAPPHGDAQTVHPALELIHVTASRGTGG